jgi:hypothetical protein
LYYYDSKIFLSAPMKNRGDKEMVHAFDLLIQSLIIRGLRPSLQRLDNEAYLALINYLTKQGIDYQLAPQNFSATAALMNRKYRLTHHHSGSPSAALTSRMQQLQQPHLPSPNRPHSQ